MSKPVTVNLIFGNKKIFDQREFINKLTYNLFVEYQVKQQVKHLQTQALLEQDLIQRNLKIQSIISNRYYRRYQEKIIAILQLEEELEEDFRRQQQQKNLHSYVL
ncbi:MAG: hypothetical protein KBD64_01970 [Gammaproteobacteria bacterium]|nr:hypothetical protein [Gammaproteobacteria bacterium]